MEIWSKCDICGRDIPVGELCYGLKKGNCICKDCCTGFENCTFTLAPAPTLTPQNKWVKVDENLPDFDVPVLVYVKDIFDNKSIINITKYTTTYNLTNNWLGYENNSFKITHWMPLPAPPGKKED